MKNSMVWLMVSGLMVASLVLASCAPAAPEEKPAAATPVEKEKAPAAKEEAAPAEKEEVAAPGKEMVKVSLTKVDGTKVEKMLEKPRYGGVMNLVMDHDVLSWDSGHMAFADDYPLNLTNEIIYQTDWSLSMYGTGEYAYSFYSTPYFLPAITAPILGEYWEIPDDETFILHVGQDIYWQDKEPVNGRQFVADDLVYAFMHIYEERPNSYHAAQAAPHQRPVDYYATDKYTFVMKTQPGMMGEAIRMNIGYIRVEPREVMEKYGDMKDWRNVVGTGPFILTDYVTGSSATLVRNPNYHENDPIHPQNQLPYLDGVKFFIITDKSTQAAALRTGKVDTVGIGGTALNWEEWDSLMKYSPELKWVKVPSGSAQTIWPRSDTAPFDDIRVRRALMMAIDREAIKNDFYMGEAVIRSAPTPDWAAYARGWTPDDELPQDIREAWEYDPDKAKQLLAEAGYPNGFKTEILAQQANVDVLSIVKDYWSRIGVELDIDVREYGAYVSLAYSQGYTQMVYAFHVISQPMRGHNYMAGGAYNFGIIDDPYLTEYYSTAGAQPWTTEAWDPWSATFKEVALYELSKFWHIEVPTPFTFRAWQPWLVNYNGEDSLVSGTNNHFNWAKYIWLDQEMKQEMTGR